MSSDLGRVKLSRCKRRQEHIWVVRSLEHFGKDFLSLVYQSLAIILRDGNSHLQGLLDGTLLLFRKL